MDFQFEPFFDLCQDLLAIIGATDGRILRVNSSWKRALDWESPQIEGRELLSLCHPDDRQKLTGICGDATGTSEVPGIDIRLIRRQGGYCWVRYTAQLRSDGLNLYAVARELDDDWRRSEAWEVEKSLFDTIIENIPVPVFLKDANDEFRIKLWNRAAEHVFQLPRERILGRNVNEFWPREQADFYRTIDEQVAREDRLVDVEEEPSRMPDGRTIYLRTRKLPLRLPGDSRIRYLLCISDDITREKELRDEVRRSEALFKSLFQNSPVSMTVYGEDRRYIRTNGAFQLLMGYSEEELRQKTIFDLTCPDDIPKSVEALTRLSEPPPVSVRITKRMMKKSGEAVWMDVTTTRIPRHSGESPIFVSVLEDISELRRREEEQSRMREEAERRKNFLQTILDASPSPIYVRGVFGDYILVNWAFERLLGVSREQVVGKRPHDFLPPELAEEFDRHDREVLQSDRGRQDEQILLLSGGERHFLTQTFLLRDSRGEVYASGGIAVDITDQTLAQRRLVQASKMSSLGEMAGGIAHEINNPLAIIHGRVRLLKVKLDSEAIDIEAFRQELTQVEKTAERIARIIKGLRTFSRASESDPMRPARVSQIVDDTLELCRARFKHHEVDLRVVLDSDPVLPCRATQISQVLMNLLGNAFDAVENLSRKWVEVRVLTEGGRALLEVTDSGRGIPEEISVKLMQPFFTTKEAGKGTGLGLSISRGIIESHHGRLYYDSTSPHTRFVVELPLAQGDAV